jgi:hypothetical protein
VALTAAGLAFLAATLEGAGRSRHASFDPLTLGLYVGLAALAATALLPLARRRPASEGMWLAVSAGALWGASDIAIKALSGRLGDLGAGVLVHPLAPAILLLSLYGLLVSGRSLQVGGAIPVIAATSATTNVLTIASGPVVFGEPLPAGTLALALRLAAFALVVGAAALTPPPLPPAQPA